MTPPFSAYALEGGGAQSTYPPNCTLGAGCCVNPVTPAICALELGGREACRRVEAWSVMIKKTCRHSLLLAGSAAC